VSWAADASHAREHLLALTRWLPSSVDPRTLNGPAGVSLSRWAMLRGRTPVSAPWNIAETIAGAAAAAAGSLLTARGTGAAAGEVAILGGLVSLAVTCLPRLRLLVAGAGAGAVTLLAALAAASVPRPLVAVLPWLAVTAAYLHFSAQSLDTMGYLGRAARGAVRQALAALARLAVGRQTWQVLTSGRRPARG
jgi:hypothetical protein